MIKKRPRHIGIIPDGNRRWAKEHGMNKQDGYKWGLLPGLRLLRQAKDLGIEEITYYGFTVDNCKRPAVQFAAFQQACVDAVELLKQEGADLLVIGNTDLPMLPGGASSLYDENPGKRRRDPAEFSCELWMGVGSVPYAPGRKALFLRYLQSGHGHPLGRHAKALRLSAPAECLR